MAWGVAVVALESASAPSIPMLANVAPSGEKATHAIGPECTGPLGPVTSPVATSTTDSRPSNPPTAKWAPSGLKLVRGMGWSTCTLEVTWPVPRSPNSTSVPSVGSSGNDVTANTPSRVDRMPAGSTSTSTVRPVGARVVPSSSVSVPLLSPTITRSSGVNAIAP
jgi:hypothetical protein